MAGTIDNALDLYGNALRGTASQRAAFLSTAADGMLWQDTDGIRMIWRKDGALWVPAVWRWRGTTAQMNSFGANAPDGFEWFSTTDNSEYVRVGGAWLGGWVDIPFSSGFRGDDAQFRLSGGVVHFQGVVIKSSGANIVTGESLFTMPAEYRPLAYFRQPVASFSSSSAPHWYLAINETTGAASVGLMSTGGGDRFYLGGVSYPI